MNFGNYYQPGLLLYSFEVFPEKTEAGAQSLLAALRDLKKFDPAFISVTYGAMGTTRDLTRDLAIRIKKELRLNTAFHFTCVGAGRAAIRRYVEYLRGEGIDLVVALRGDPPKGTAAFVKPEDGFSYAGELVHYLREINGFSIAVAGYPEGHIEAPDKETDLIHLKEKVDAGADIVITQLFFDNADYFDFVARARKIGITIPIVPGIMPILNLKQIEKITGLCGATLPDGLHKQLRENQDNSETVRAIGIRHAIEQCRGLIKGGVPGIHFYTLNRSVNIRQILEGLDLCQDRPH